MRFRPVREPQWEVIDRKEVEPTPVYYDSDDELEICRVATHEVSGTYTFDVSSPAFRTRDALTHARANLMEEIAKQGIFNFLVLEGWSLTTLQKSKARRIEVRYRARPAVARGAQRARSPPFLALLDSR